MLIIIAGPSGVGKTTVQGLLVESGIEKVVSCTTRERRDGEKDGVDYHFIEKEDFNTSAMIDYTVFQDNLYGIRRGDISDAAIPFKNVVLDGNGKFNLHNYCYEKNIACTLIMLDASTETLEKRLIETGRDKRVENIALEKRSFIHDSFDVVIETDNIPATEVCDIILKSVKKT